MMQNLPQIVTPRLKGGHQSTHQQDRPKAENYIKSTKYTP